MESIDKESIPRSATILAEGLDGIEERLGAILEEAQKQNKLLDKIVGQLEVMLIQTAGH